MTHRGPIRIPAGEIERLVCSRIQTFLRSPHEGLDTLSWQRKDVAVTRGVLAVARNWSELLANPETTETLYSRRRSPHCHLRSDRRSACG